MSFEAETKSSTQITGRLKYMATELIIKKLTFTHSVLLFSWSLRKENFMISEFNYKQYHQIFTEFNQYMLVIQSIGSIIICLNLWFTKKERKQTYLIDLIVMIFLNHNYFFFFNLFNFIVVSLSDGTLLSIFCGHQKLKYRQKVSNRPNNFSIQNWILYILFGPIIK